MKFSLFFAKSFFVCLFVGLFYRVTLIWLIWFTKATSTKHKRRKTYPTYSPLAKAIVSSLSFEALTCLQDNQGPHKYGSSSIKIILMLVELECWQFNLFESLNSQDCSKWQTFTCVLSLNEKARHQSFQPRPQLSAEGLKQRQHFLNSAFNFNCLYDKKCKVANCQFLYQKRRNKWEEAIN